MNRKIRYIFVVLFNFLLSKFLFSAYYGQQIVDNARLYIDREYDWGQPPNETDTNITTLPGKYVYKDREVWDFENWNGKFDCSGLVSLCAGLRRHFACSEIQSYLTNPVDWDSWRAGDLVIRSGVEGRSDHVRIVEKIENGVVIFIEAYGGDERKVRRWYAEISDLQQLGY